LLQDSSTVTVFFLRPTERLMMGVRGKPMGITLDGEHLMDLSVGQYTLVKLRPGSYNTVVTNWTLLPPKSAVVETSRDFILDLSKPEPVYLRFTLENSNYWRLFRESFSDSIRQQIAAGADTVVVPMGKNVSMRLSSATRSAFASGATGYKVESLSREAAIGAAAKLEPVEGAERSPLH
jgi:hypothetical protein